MKSCLKCHMNRRLEIFFQLSPRLSPIPPKTADLPSLPVRPRIIQPPISLPPAQKKSHSPFRALLLPRPSRRNPGYHSTPQESPTTSILSSPCAATHAAAPPPAAEEDQSPSALECTGAASLIPLAVFPPLPPADPAPPPAPKQSPQPAPKQPSRPKNKGDRLPGIQ